MRKLRIFKPQRLNRSVAGNGLLFFLMGIFGVLMALPLVMIVNNALKPLDELFQYPPKLFVRNPTLDNFVDLFVAMNASWVPFSRYLLNTLIITVGGTWRPWRHIRCPSTASRGETPCSIWWFCP